MRRVSIDYLSPGMKVARSVYYSDDCKLLASGMQLTSSHIKRLKRLGIPSVYVDDGFFEVVEDIPDVISEKTKVESVRVTREAFAKLTTKRRININDIRKTVDNLMEDILNNKNILINCYDIRSYDDYTFSHCVNVCVLSIITGISMGVKGQNLKELGVGALLHDIGKLQIEKEILNKPGKLTDDEYGKVKYHPEYGYSILSAYKDVPPLSAAIAFQHHERWDGKGYPKGLKGEKIHEYSRIVAVADVFDALTTDRPYRKACAVNQAIDYIDCMSNTAFDEKVSVALVSNIAPYPPGTVVMLNNRLVGQVITINKKVPDRPIIKIYFNEDLEYISAPFAIDLANQADLFISRVLTEAEINTLVKSNTR